MVQTAASVEIRDISNLNERRKCTACGLHLNQLPAFDEQKLSSVFWVGLSAVQFSNDEEKIPLSPYTRSGALIRSIEHPYSDLISFYKTNVVKCLPLTNDKIRYPVINEMEKCYPNLQYEITVLKPSLIFLLGRQVGAFVLGKLSKSLSSLNNEFIYNSYSIDGITYVPIHHPSYVLVYKRKDIQTYISSIQSLFESQLSVVCR
jgi:uracil-DNA glycosylase